MQLKNLKYIPLAGILVALTGCDDFLDHTPDNRVTISTPTQVTQLLVNAYSDGNHATICELSSDNIVDNTSPDENGVRYNLSGNSNYAPADDEAFAWEEIKSGIQQDTPSHIWAGAYHAIAVCNYALQAIEQLEAQGRGSEVTAQKGEALVSRAYHHFILANLFCLPYAGAEASKSIPGIPYMIDVEKELKPQYDRGNLADVYDRIEQDLVEGLPLVNDNLHPLAPKYHFTIASAHAFAARFYLFARKYDLAEKHATIALGDAGAPSSMRNFWTKTFTTSDALTQAYIDPSDPGNLMLVATSSIYYRVVGLKYAHNREAKNATTHSVGPTWTKYNFHPCMSGKLYYRGQSEYGSLYAPMFEFFEYTDKIAGIGYVHHIRPEFTKEEVLLTRAEARIYMRKITEAVADLSAWDANRWNNLPVSDKPDCKLTLEVINKFYADEGDSNELRKNGIVSPVNIDQVCTPANASWNYGADIQHLVECVLHFRRLERLDMGDRWFDIRRNGIEITHKIGRSRVEHLTLGDPRRAFQIPADVLSAGFPENNRLPISSGGSDADATLSTESYKKPISTRP
ncbi:RagB/SusD family nutrient uptake outer membrane protein [Muribaculum intestinale]|uniref:RagB/SusD family nutrient uptake outer membrane protein n=1 Tax=Muribaculum intestinale TaxID=1796646 RepID=UPI0025B11F34|nr:RagB/SusD family nutrient uptake outer membrane protein [Muribaculum intestinale]